MMAPPRPVTLRDFLELACDSSSDGFRSYPRALARDADAQPQPPVRLVLAADYQHHHLRRSPSRSPSFSLFSSLSRTFSRRIKEGFWRRRFDDEEAYFDDRDSCGFPSPLVSSCSASSDSESDDDDPEAEDSNKPASAPASECDGKASSSSSFSSSSSADHEDDCTDDAAPAADGNKVQMQMQAVVAEEGDPTATGRKLGTMEDKQQLSPVSVLDFPLDDDEGSDAGTCSPAFLRRPTPDLLLHITRTKQHKARRYDPAVDVDLDARFLTATSESGDSVGASTRLATSSSTTTDSSSSGATATTAPRHVHEEEHHPSSPCQEPDDNDEYRLLARLLEEGFAEFLVDDEVARALVLHFFAEGVADRRLRSAAGCCRVAEEEEALVRAAAEWLRGEGPRWGVGRGALGERGAGGHGAGTAVDVRGGRGGGARRRRGSGGDAGGRAGGGAAAGALLLIDYTAIQGRRRWKRCRQ